MTQSEPSFLSETKDSTHSRWIDLFFLLLLGLFSFTYHLEVSLFEGTEGLYGQVTREMVQNGEFVDLTFQEQRYLNKPPLYFWMTGAMTQLFGDQEAALRLPGSLFSLGTMIVTFLLGRTLFSWNVGFWAAIIFATNHVFLWYGRRVLIDSTLTFFMTTAVLSWILASRKGANSAWYVLFFLSIALGGLVKGLHGFILPLVLLLVYSLWLRDFQALKRWGFWAGGLLFVIIIEIFAAFWGPSFQYHFGVGSLFLHISEWLTQGGSPTSIRFPPYLYLIWFDFFPWSIWLPFSMFVLFKMRPFRNHPEILLVVLWFLGYLIGLCLSKYSREPYLMPLVPPFALAIGYYLVSLTSPGEGSSWARRGNGIASGLLTVLVTVALWFGPILLNKKWNVSLDLFPVWYVLTFLVLGVMVTKFGFQGQFTHMRRGLAAVGISFVFGILQFFLPAMDAAGSPRMVNALVREKANNLSMPIVHYGLTQEDIIYYLNADPPIPRLTNFEEIVQLANSQTILLVTDKEDRKLLMNSPGIEVSVIKEYPQPRKRTFFLLRIKTSEPQQK